LTAKLAMAAAILLVGLVALFSLVNAGGAA
jgi:hypothetical protein